MDRVVSVPIYAFVQYDDCGLCKHIVLRHFHNIIGEDLVMLALSPYTGFFIVTYLYEHVLIIHTS